MSDLSKRKFDLCNVLTSTSWAQEYVDKCKLIVEDPDKVLRLEAQECVVCFYNSRLGSAVVTDRPCCLCEIMLYCGSSCIDRLCKDCAEKYKLCKHCGADINLRNRRKF